MYTDLKLSSSSRFFFYSRLDKKKKLEGSEEKKKKKGIALLSWFHVGASSFHSIPFSYAKEIIFLNDLWGIILLLYIFGAYACIRT